MAAVYSEEPSKALIKQIKSPKFLNVLSNLEIRFDEDFISLPEEKLLDDLAMEYSRLFIGPGKHISPHESVHLKEGNGSGLLWGEATAKVKKFIESSGLVYKYEYCGIPDHISVELEFVQKVTNQAVQTWENKDFDRMLYCLKIEKKFIEEHLIKWTPLFCDKIIKSAKLSFYREIAKLTKSFMKFVQKEIEHHYDQEQI